MGSPTSPQVQESLSDKWKRLRNEGNGPCPVTNRISSRVQKTGFSSHRGFRAFITTPSVMAFFGESVCFFITHIACMGFDPSNQNISILCKKGLDVSDKLMREQHKGYFGTDLVILNSGQITRTVPELATLTKLPHHTGGSMIERATSPIQEGSSVESSFEPGPLRFRGPYDTCHI
ncbi:hypothetical protein AVEN_34877-1 [Araneus ventricosus]|uniref:Uncharacterized protein n=1 Tax=Araneus ventricosus TaxID=182803 RepID=A0A4Y2N6B7_ARAVE|nr:hypothetical protein AVEN_34877-1 [Araneus ventricosus]